MSSAVRAKTTGTSVRRAVSRIRATKKRSLTAATTRPSGGEELILLLPDAQPVPVPLRQVRQRGQVPHPVDVDGAEEMIRLVLDDAGEEVLGHEIDLTAEAIETLQP